MKREIVHIEQAKCDGPQACLAHPLQDAICVEVCEREPIEEAAAASAKRTRSQLMPPHRVQAKPKQETSNHVLQSM